MRTIRKEKKNRSMVTAVLIGLLLSVGVLLAGGAVLSVLLLNETIDLNSGSFVVDMIALLAALLGSLLAQMLAAGENRLLLAGSAALALSLLLLSGNILLFEGVLSGFLGILVAIIIGTTISLLLNRAGNRRAFRRHKARSR